jgi:L-ascorbate metabolism protein UlaG (beta-lactamase superfamily)
VATLLLDDGTSAVLTDGFFSRPSLLSVALRRIAPDTARIGAALSRAGVRRLDAVVPVHTHFDHVMDSPEVALRTGATLVGGSSTAQVGRGGSLPTDRIHEVRDGESVTFGAWTLRFTASTHCPPDRFPGAVTAPVTPPVRAREYRCGDAWSILATHSSGPSALIQGSAGYVPGSLSGQQAEVVYLGVGQLGIQEDAYIEAYWEHVVRAVGARRVVLIHWDDFFRGLDRPLRALPYVGDDLDASMRVLQRLSAADDVRLSLPTVFRREDPWA